MSEYRVYWEIDVEADSFEEAAEIARTVQQDPNNHATFYEVAEHSLGNALGEKQSVDLGAEE